MKWLVLVLKKIAQFSLSHPWFVIVASIIISALGFGSMPWLVTSTNLLAGVGKANPVINLTRENNEHFGDRESLALVLDFPEPPGKSRLEFIEGLANRLSKISGIVRVRYRLINPDDRREVETLFQHFLLGMDSRERLGIQKILSPEGVKDAFRITRNHLILLENSHLKKQLMSDPLGLSNFVAHSMEKQTGPIGLGDPFLLIASPDSTLYLIQIAPNFPSSDIVKARELMEKLHKVIPETIRELNAKVHVVKDLKDLKWDLTGKTAFQYESDVIFDEETSRLLIISFGLVLITFLSIYRSFIAAAILMIPLAAGIGPNYGLLYLAYDEVNPVVMGATGVLLGLGAEYGVHLWGRFREELDIHGSTTQAVFAACEHTGPPVILGALTGIIAFLCLCFSGQSALVQFGFFGATGLALTMLSTIFLFPAMVSVLGKSQRDLYPKIQESFGFLAGLYKRNPGAIVAASCVLICVGAFYATKVTHEQDLFKVFLARDMNSMAVSDKISHKFHTNFSQSTQLTFDVKDFDAGLTIQRKLDQILVSLMAKPSEIASFDSISRFVAPTKIQKANLKIISEIVTEWPELRKVFVDELADSDFSATARTKLQDSFDSTGKMLADMTERDIGAKAIGEPAQENLYVAKLGGKFRFLTDVRYSDTITNPEDLRSLDKKIMGDMKGLPVEVHMSGTRQTMDAILSSLVDELFRLGTYAFVSLTMIFLVVFPNPLGVALCLVPMIGSFAITLGAAGFMKAGLPFSVVCVAPLVFGFSIHNGIHVVMGSLHEKNSDISRTMARVTPRAILTSVTIMAGFVAMVTSRHYSMEFLGWSMIAGMVSAVPLTLVTLPALLLLVQKRRLSKIGGQNNSPGKELATGA
ncbi:MAG: efflux RND transporter permease subunit [Desulfomonilaceae bacterium]